MAIDIPATYDRYGAMVLRRCLHLLRDEALAQDAAQDVFVQLVIRQASIEDRGLSSLLFQMATGVSLNRLRSRRRHPETPGEALLEQIAAAEDPEERTASRRLLRRLLSAEPPSTRVMATMHWVDGMTHAEVAEAFAMSVSGVRKRLREMQARVAALRETDAHDGQQTETDAHAREGRDVG